MIPVLSPWLSKAEPREGDNQGRNIKVHNLHTQSLMTHVALMRVSCSLFSTPYSVFGTKVQFYAVQCHYKCHALAAMQRPQPGGLKPAKRVVSHMFSPEQLSL